MSDGTRWAMGSFDRYLLAITEISLMLGITLAVLAFGGNEPASFAIVEVLLFGTAALNLTCGGLGSRRISPACFLISGGLVAIVLAQLCPMPASWIGRAAESSGAHYSSLTIESYSTRSELLILLTCLIGFFLAQIVAQDRKRMRRLAQFFVVLGVFESLYGLVQYLAGWQRIFLYIKKYDLEEATGTYINRNHYAGFLEMALPFSLALAWYEFRKLRRGHNESATSLRDLLVSQSGLPKLILYVFIAVLLLTALFFSRSRMGILAASASILVIFVLATISGRHVKAGLVLSIAFAIVAGSAAIWIGPGPIAERFENVSQEYSQYDRSRLSIWRGTGLLIEEHPFLGTGLGTFPIAYTKVQSTFLGEFVNHAHNDYLEIASDLGLPAAFALFASLIYLFVRAAQGFLSAEKSFDRAVALACAGSMLAIFLHGLTDFNLHIPANALLFSSILGLSLAVGPRKSTASREIA